MNELQYKFIRMHYKAIVSKCYSTCHSSFSSSILCIYQYCVVSICIRLNVFCWKKFRLWNSITYLFTLFGWRLLTVQLRTWDALPERFIFITKYDASSITYLMKYCRASRISSVISLLSIHQKFCASIEEEKINIRV